MNLCLPALLMMFWIMVCPITAVERGSRRGGRGRSSHVMRGFERQDLIPSQFELYQPCKSSYDCQAHIAHSHCDYTSRTCVCQQYHVPYNNSLCLPPSLLGYGCAIDRQCQVKVDNSVCVDGLCTCKEKHVQLRLDKCLPPAPIGAYCIHQKMCSLNDAYSVCNWIIPGIYGKCSCPLDYRTTQDGHCLPHLGSKCQKHADCETLTPNSFCEKEGDTATCACRDGYEPSPNYMECNEVPDYETEPPVDVISLGKACQFDLECQARDPYSYCLNGTCECISPDATCNARNTGCYEGSFQCRDGYCISWFFVCDNQMNCPDNSDEDECIPHHCPDMAFQCDDGTCLPRSSVCNGHWECPDGSDEARCYKGIACDRNAFRCKNGQCLPPYVFCNAVQDCDDGSDEIDEICNEGANCTTSDAHQCENGRCRSTAILCSGMDGCGDNTDELACDVCYCPKP